MPWAKLAAIVAAAGILAAAYHFSLPCPVRHFFGIICPGCGMTHAVLALLRLDFPAAFGENPLFVLLPVTALYFIFDGQVFGQKADRIILFLMPIAVLAVYIPRLVCFLTA